LRESRRRSAIAARAAAVDLSLTPKLAYAKRKTRALEVANIDYAQADLLKLGALNRTFGRDRGGWRVAPSRHRSLAGGCCSTCSGAAGSVFGPLQRAWPQAHRWRRAR